MLKKHLAELNISINSTKRQYNNDDIEVQLHEQEYKRITYYHF